MYEDFNKTYYPLTEQTKKALMAYMCSISGFGTASNLFILIVYRNNFKKYPSIYLLFTLSIVDLIVSAIVAPLTLLTYLPVFIKADLLCQFTYFTRYFTISWSVYLMFLIGVQCNHTIASRTIRLAIRGLKLNTIRSSGIASVCGAVICLLYSMGTFLVYESADDLRGCSEKDYYEVKIYDLTGVVLLCVMILYLILVYINIFIIAKKNATRVRIHTVEQDNQLYLIQQQQQKRQVKKMSSAESVNNKVLQLKSIVNINVSTICPANASDSLTYGTYGHDISLKRTKSNEQDQQRQLKEMRTKTERPRTQSENGHIIKTTALKTTTKCKQIDIIYNYDVEYEGNNNGEYRKPSYPLDSIYETSFDTHAETFGNAKYNFEKEIKSIYQRRMTMANTNISSVGGTTNDCTYKDDMLTKLEAFYSNMYLRKNSSNKRVSNQIDLKTFQNDMNKNDIPRLRRMTSAYIRRDWRVARMFALVTLTFVITWFPYCLITLDVIRYDPIIANIYFLNNAINPIIYSILSKSFRFEAIKLLRTIFRIKTKKNSITPGV